MIEKKFGIIGKPLSHSLSPFLHNFWFKKYKIFAKYSLIEIEPDEIEGIIKKIKSEELHGINVTVPYKQAVIPFLDLILNNAKQTSSVNTINLNKEGKVVGNNTDVYGLEHGFIKQLDYQNLNHNSVLILGAGGVTPSVIYALSTKGIKNVFISNRTIKKAEYIKKMFPFIKIVKWENLETVIGKMDIIINATSLGLKGGDNFKQEFKYIKPTLVYYDVIYNPEETRLMKLASERGAKTLNGYKMLELQAEKSWSIWHS